MDIITDVRNHVLPTLDQGCLGINPTAASTPAPRPELLNTTLYPQDPGSTSVGEQFQGRGKGSTGEPEILCQKVSCCSQKGGAGTLERHEQAAAG